MISTPLVGSRSSFSVNSIAISAAIVLLVVSVANAIRNYYRLHQFKGPWLGCFTSLWIVKTTLAGRINEETHRVNEQYGMSALFEGNRMEC